MDRIPRWIRAHPRTVDVALIVVLSVPALIDPPPGRARWIQAVVLAGLLLPLVGRRRHPAAMTVVVLGVAWAALLGDVWQQRLPLAHLTLEIMIYCLVVRGRRRPAGTAALAVAGFVLAWTATWYTGSAIGWGAAGYGLSIATAWLLGEYVRARRAYLGEVERRARLADSERAALARAAVAEERARIARELHDVLAHNIGVMVVNAEGALLLRDQDPTAAYRTLQLVSSTGRAALTELRRMLAVLHVEGPLPEASIAEQDLRQLGEAATAAGMPTTVRLMGTSDAVPASAMLQVYRIVQEAVTNVVKHAGPGATAEVTVDFGQPARRRAVRIEVCDGGGSHDLPRPPLPSAGRGLVGIRERVALFGGTVEAAARPGGGFRLAATLPLDTASTAESQPGLATMG